MTISVVAQIYNELRVALAVMALRAMGIELSWCRKIHDLE